jgi:hypothetical protein
MWKCPVPGCDGYIVILNISHTRQYLINTDDTIEPHDWMQKVEDVYVKLWCSKRTDHGENYTKQWQRPDLMKLQLWELPDYIWNQLPDDLKQASDRVKEKDKD